MKFLFSMSLTGALLLVFAITIGTATFIENDFGADAAKIIWGDWAGTWTVVRPVVAAAGEPYRKSQHPGI